MLERSRIKNPDAVALGRRGGIKGGPARAKKLSATRRSAIASRAARARWGAATSAEPKGDSPRDRGRTEKRIARAALTEFAAHGLAGARVDRIARRAGVNKRMIYHYVGGKELLFRTLLREYHQSAIGEAPTAVRYDILEDFARARRLAIEQPEWIRLAMWEALSQRRLVELHEERKRFWEVAVDEVRSAQSRGELDREFDPAQLQLAFVALAMFPFAFHQITELVTGHPPTSETFLRGHAAFIATLASRM
jgi:AcrR family transcriptional regulator